MSDSEDLDALIVPLYAPWDARAWENLVETHGEVAEQILAAVGGGATPEAARRRWGRAGGGRPMRTNNNLLAYRPCLLRSKSPRDFGRRFASWQVTVGGPGGLTYHVGMTEQLMANGRDRRRDWISGDFIPLRRFRYWPSNLETAHQNA